MQRRTLQILLFSLLISGATALALWFQSTRWGNWLELRSYDVRFRLRGPLQVADRPPILILGVDDQSFERISDPLLLWQKHFGLVLQGLTRAGAAAVGIDFILGDISSIAPENQQVLMQSLLLARRSDTRIILSYRVRQDSVDQPPPLLVVAAGEDNFAYANLTTDNDDFVRRQELYTEAEEGKVRSGFAYALASAWLQRDHENEVEPPPSRNVLINFAGRSAFRQIPFWQALEAAEQPESTFLEENFRDAIVLLGITGDEDLHSTPLYYWPNSPGQPRRTQGVEIHANTIMTLLQGRGIEQAPFTTTLAVTALLVAATALACLYFSPWLAVLLSGGFWAVYLAVVFYGAFPQDLWWMVVAPTAGIALTLTGGQSVNYFLEGREKRQMRTLFQRYVSDDVLSTILRNPGNLALKGEKREVTILFSDLRNFTGRSEGLSPEELVSQLNEYFTAMVEVIQDNRGLVDKFIGDGIMAVFGAPLADPDSAAHAVAAATGMVKALRELNRSFRSRGIPPLEIGIGLHSGEAVVGNVGSPRKIEYTAIGDVVNTASRIEGLNKKHLTEILVSAETKRRAGDAFPMEFLGEEPVKGKTLAVPVYQVVVPDGPAVPNRPLKRETVQA